MLLRLAWKSLWSRRTPTALTVASIALSMMLLTAVDQLRGGVQAGFSGTISKTDLVVGARGGGLPLLLSTVFHIGNPSNEIQWESYQHFAHHAAVAWTIPISMGDSHRGFRVIATDENFYAHYHYRGDHSLVFAQGRAPATYSETSLGADVASRLHYRLGQQIVLSHGVESHSILNHEQHPFTITGILAPTATPIDGAIYITLLGEEAMHFGWEGGTPPAIGEKVPPLDPSKLSVDHITAFLLGAKSRISTLYLQREIDTYEGEPLTAIIPAYTLHELWTLLDYADAALSAMSSAVILSGLLSMLIALYTTLNERQHEIAIYRSLGMHRYGIFALFLYEAVLVAACGVVAGFSITYLGFHWMSGFLQRMLAIPIGTVGLTLRVGVYALATVTSAALLALAPAFLAYRRSLPSTLSRS